MRLHLLLAATVLFAISTAAVGADKKTDLDKMQGDWKVSSAKGGGKDAPPYVLQGKMKISGNTFTLVSTRNGKERKEPIDVKVDSSKSPKQIDFVGKDGKVQNQGIYKLEEKKLTLCFARGGERPTKFESKEGSKSFLMVLERVK